MPDFEDYTGRTMIEEPPENAYVPGEDDDLNDEPDPPIDAGAAKLAATRILQEAEKKLGELEEGEVLVHTLIIEMPAALFDQQSLLIEQLTGRLSVDDEGDIIVPENVVVKLRSK